MFGSVLNRLLGSHPSDASFTEIRHASETGEAHVVDVREAAEFASGHVPGAMNMPLSRFDARQLPTGKPVILICQAGGRSARALGACAGLRTDVRHFSGGMSGWRARGSRRALNANSAIAFARPFV